MRRVKECPLKGRRTSVSVCVCVRAVNPGALLGLGQKVEKPMAPGGCKRPP